MSHCVVQTGEYNLAVATGNNGNHVRAREGRGWGGVNGRYKGVRDEGVKSAFSTKRLRRIPDAHQVPADVQPKIVSET